MTRRKTKTPNIRVGDCVKIVKPDFFVRCGYPLHFQSELEKVKHEHGDSIVQFLDGKGIRFPHGYEDNPYGWPPAEKIAKALTYEFLKQKNFGGKDRKIYAHELPEHGGKQYMVSSVKFVKTGSHLFGHCYDGEHEGNCLANETTHRIIMLTARGIMPGRLYSDHLWIDAENVELMDGPVPFEVAVGINNNGVGVV